MKYKCKRSSCFQTKFRTSKKQLLTKGLLRTFTKQLIYLTLTQYNQPKIPMVPEQI